MNSFEEIGLNEEILNAIKELGYETPTPIQAKTIPHLLASDQDIMALAQTGTGKTAAFGLPSIQNTDISDKSTQTLILSPTRELCIQIAKDIESYAKHSKGLNVVAVYGGSSIENQIRALKKGAQIVVGTPGRTKDLLNRKKLSFDSVERVILDEADEMLNMGFKDELDAILEKTPDTKQTLLFSATMSKEIRRIANKYMHNPIELSVERTNIGAKNVKHINYTVLAKDKYEVLKRIADINPDIYGIIFCRTRRETKEIANKFMHDGYNSDALHGDLSQAQRDEVMNRFRKRQLQILVATDVAARGLDINDLTHVINYNLPDDNEVYIHRSGRTGRAGKSGTSIIISNTRERRKIGDIERKFNLSFENANVPTGKDICTVQLYSLIDKIQKIEVDEEQIAPFLPAIYEKLETLSREDLIKHFVSAEFNRFLAYYKNARDINTKGRGSKDSSQGERRSRKERRAESNLSRLYINAGSKTELNPARLIGLINNALDSGDANIGEIEILGKFSFFEIDSDVVEKLIKQLTGQKFEGISLVIQVSNEKPKYKDKKKKSSRRSKYRSDRSDSRGYGRRSSKSGNKRGGKNRRSKKR